MPNVSLPTRTDVARLPPWALAAFGGRCARRVFEAARLRHAPDPFAPLAAGIGFVLDEWRTAESRHTTPRADSLDQTLSLLPFLAVGLDLGGETDPAHVGVLTACAAVAHILADPTRAPDLAKAAGVPVPVIAADFADFVVPSAGALTGVVTTFASSGSGPPPERTRSNSVRLVLKASAGHQLDAPESQERLESLYQKLNEYCRLEYGVSLARDAFDEQIRAWLGWGGS